MAATPHDRSGLPKRVTDQLDRMADAFVAIEALLHRLGVQGLQRMSAASADELAALSQTAHNAGLVTIERDLNRLTTHVKRALERDPLFEMASYRGTINRVWLTHRRARARFEAGALPAEMLDLIGVARRRYTLREAPLDVQALGAAGWVSDSGFVGVTIHYIGLDGQAYTVAAARPTMYFGEDPVRLMRFPANDALEQTTGELSHGAWRFGSAKVSDDNRLSLHKELRVLPAAYLGGRAYAPYHAARWIDLVERLRAAEVHPVGGGAETLAYIEPASVSPVVTDDTFGRARATATDDHGAQLDLEVLLRRENNLLIDNLERMYGPRSGERRAPRADGLFGRVTVDGDRLVFQPMTGVWARPLRVGRRGRGDQHTVHLSLESLEGARHV